MGVWFRVVVLRMLLSFSSQFRHKLLRLGVILENPGGKPEYKCIYGYSICYWYGE